MLPRIDERQDDDFYRSASESDSFSSGEDEDGVPTPDLREVKKKSKSKADSLREKPPISSKRAKPPIPVQSANGDENAYGRFVAVKAGDLFDVSEGEEEEEGENPEGQDEENEDEKERFFQPEEENEDSDDEDAKENSRKNSKRQRSKGDENASESEEEEKEEVGKDDEKRRLSKNGSDQLRLVTTSVSKFKKKSKKEDASPEIGLEEEEEEHSGENEETEKKENAVNEEEDTAEKRDEEVKDEGEDKDEDEDEPRVEFAGDAKLEVRFSFIFVSTLLLNSCQHGCSLSRLLSQGRLESLPWLKRREGKRGIGRDKKSLSLSLNTPYRKQTRRLVKLWKFHEVNLLSRSNCLRLKFVMFVGLKLAICNSF